MPEGYLHLTCEQRCQIYALLQSGHSQAHIARKIGADPSTISRELVLKRCGSPTRISWPRLIPRK
jgi:IS30 family transposase